MLPTFIEIAEILMNEDATIQFLIERGIIFAQKVCICGNLCQANLALKSYRCAIRNCKQEVTIFRGTFFYRHTLAKNRILHMAHLWLCSASVSLARNYIGFAEDTICCARN